VTNPNDDVFIDYGMAEDLILAHLSNETFYGNVKNSTIMDKEYAVTQDAVVTVPLETYFGPLNQETLDVAYQRINKAERAGLLGNGVVPPMCTIAFEELLQNLTTGNFQTEYLPDNYATVSDMEKAIVDKKLRKKARIIPTNVWTRDKTVLNWATPTKRDYKDASNNKASISRVKEGKTTIVRAESTTPSSCFTYYYKANNIQPIDPTTLDYPTFNLNVNQNWVETLMGLEVGWTDPLFGWNRKPDGKLI
jgi:hypothetical protein